MRCLSEEALSRISNGATAVAPRLLEGAVISRQFVERMAANAQRAWQRPRVLTAQAWLVELWKRQRARGTEQALLLSAAQELAVWQEIIERDNLDLIEIAKTARDARAASLKCAEYGVSLTGARWEQDDDAEKFLRWHREFERRCSRERWITLSTVWRMLPNWLAEERRSGDVLVLAGFVNRAPALEAAVRAWRSAGGEAYWDDIPSTDTTPCKLACTSFDEEIEHAARWARALVEGGATSIGVVVPGLEDQSNKTERIFDDVFYPGHLSRGLDADAEPGGVFHLSAGTRLGEHPLIASALLLLETATAEMRVMDVSAILRSPYWRGATEERHQRARADLRLRKARSLDVSLETVKNACGEAPIAYRYWQQRGLFLRRAPEVAEFPYWAKFLTELLSLAGWPGDDVPSGDQPALDQWQEAIGVLASLGAVSGMVSRAKATASLRGILSRLRRQRGSVNSPVQVLDGSEAEGIRFDHLWVTGLSTEQWRPRFDGVSFVPLSLLREAGLPATSARGRREELRRSVEQLLGSAPDVTASFAGDPLSFLEKIEEPNLLPQRWQGPRWRSVAFAPAMMDQLGGSVAPHPKSVRPGGGTNLIKYQSACPFRAFAEIRLAAKPMAEGTFGFDPLDRGKFLHGVLEEVWLRLGSQEKLKLLTGGELRQIVEESIRLKLDSEELDSDFDRELAQAELERLREVTLEWLELEKQRLIPFEVLQLEEKQAFDLNGINIDLRLDRIDKLPSGKLLLIDYKSGKRKLEDLGDARPTEPQMLVYAAALGEEVEGVLFGQVVRGEVNLVGYSREKHLKDKQCEALGGGWPAQRRRWDSAVYALAEEFRSGEAAVNPAKGACKYCHLKPLCRVQEARTRDSEADQ